MQLEIRLALTLTLSPKEREPARAVLGKSLIGEHFSSAGNPFSLPMKRNVGRASRLPPSAEPTERPRSLGRVSWAGETPALRWHPRGSRTHNAQKVREVLSWGVRASVYSN